MKIGLLDFGNYSQSLNTIEKISALIEYAEAADQLNYNRFWIGEHHLVQDSLAWSNPQVILPLLAASTDKIKIGVAGVLIGIHEPYHVACNFKLLSNMFPGRIDLGLAKGGIEVGENIANLKNLMINGKLEKSIFDEVFHKNSLNVVDYLNKAQSLSNIGTYIPSLDSLNPSLWLLGTSYNQINQALELRSNFSRSLFHINKNDNYDRVILNNYRNNFLSKHGVIPETNLAIAGYCSESRKNCENVINSLKQSNLSIDPNYCIVGSPNEVFDKISTLCQSYDYNEIVILNISTTQKNKLNSIECIAKVFGLE